MVANRKRSKEELAAIHAKAATGRKGASTGFQGITSPGASSSLSPIRKLEQTTVAPDQVQLVEDLSGQQFYHLTDHPDFKPSLSYQNEDQEFGTGLYITNDVDSWDVSLRGREFAVPIDTSLLKVAREENLPSKMKMAKDLKAAGYDGKKIQEKAPKGNTFNRNPIDIATKREWLKIKGFDGIIPIKSRDEGEQLIIFNLSAIQTEPAIFTSSLRTREGGYV